MKLTFDDFPRWLNPKLKHKEIKKCYDNEIKRIEENAARRENPFYGCCIAQYDYIKLQGSSS